MLFAACCRYRKRKSKRPLGRLAQASPLPRGGIGCTGISSLEQEPRQLENAIRSMLSVQEEEE